jgi:hypothetical protein
MQKQNARKTFDELMTASKAVLEHHFNNHEFCGDWCPAKRGIKSDSYRCKGDHGKLYELHKGVMEEYATS